MVRSLQHENARYYRPLDNELPLSPRGGGGGGSGNVTPTIITEELQRRRPLTYYLFPSLQNFSEKSIYNKISGVLFAPVLFILAVTLPVVREENGDGRIRLDEVVVEEQETTAAGWNQWLTAIQLVGAPTFVATVLAIHGVNKMVYLLSVAGLVASVAFLRTTSPRYKPRLYWMMSFMGFAIAVWWIYAIANEVVSVLQAIGMALGISDAILGLTVFAVVSNYYKSPWMVGILLMGKYRATVWVISLPM